MIALQKYLTTLRDYQRLAFQLVLKRLKEKSTRLYVSLPTGTGKSVILTALAIHACTQGRVLVLVHRQDLVIQLTASLRHVELDVGMVMQGHREVNHAVTVATPQSLLTNVSAFLQASDNPVKTVLIDEAHHAVEGSPYELILTTLETAFPPEPIAAIGFTATPYRSDTKSMLAVLPTCAFIREIPEMIKGGWLAPLIWVPLPLDVDLSALPTTTQTGEIDYSERALTQLFMHTALMEEIVRQIVPHLEQRPTLVFAISVEQAEQLAALFCQAGYAAVAVSGRTSQTQREHIYAEWRTGSIQIVCNCSLLTEGFDFPAIAALIIARPTRSPGFYVQMLGRGMRKAPGKQDCLVIDVIGNHPELSHQMVLPTIVGVNKQAEIHAGTKHIASSNTSDVLFSRRMEGASVQTGIALLNPIGASPYRWLASSNSYFTMVNSHTAAILERDTSGSGLYQSRLYTMERGQAQRHQWIEQNYLPLRQQVARVQETTDALYHTSLGSKDAPWLDEPTSDKQLTVLKRLAPGLAAQAESEQWTKGKASDAITFCFLMHTLRYPPRKEDTASP